MKKVNLGNFNNTDYPIIHFSDMNKIMILCIVNIVLTLINKINGIIIQKSQIHSKDVEVSGTLEFKNIIVVKNIKMQ